MSGLTPRQSEALAFIRAYATTHVCSPSFDELTAALGLKSKSGIHRLLKGLEERGYIRRLKHRPRAIGLVEELDEADLFSYVNRMDGPSRRRLIAMAAGLEAAADGDGGVGVAQTLRRIADRLTGAPRRAAA